jgi:hypothetical protein
MSTMENESYVLILSSIRVLEIVADSILNTHDGAHHYCHMDWQWAVAVSKRILM